MSRVPIGLLGHIGNYNCIRYKTAGSCNVTLTYSVVWYSYHTVVRVHVVSYSDTVWCGVPCGPRNRMRNASEPERTSWKKKKLK